MPDVTCVNHPNRPSVGKCSRCEQHFCLDCLDVETGRPLCKDCLANRPFKRNAEAPKPVISSEPPSLHTHKPNDTSISLDDLFTAPAKPVTPSSPTPAPETKVETDEPAPIVVEASGPEPPQPVVIPKMKLAPAISFMDSPLPAVATADSDFTAEPGPAPAPEEPKITSSPEPAPIQSSGLPAFKPMDNDPLGLFKNPPPIKVPTLDPTPKTEPAAAMMPKLNVEPSKPVEVTKAKSAPMMNFPDTPATSKIPDPSGDLPTSASNFDLAGMMKRLDNVETEAAQTKSEPVTAKPLLEKISTKDLHAVKVNPMDKVRPVLSALWLKIDLLAAKLRMPGFVLVALLAAIIGGGLTFLLQSGGGPVVTLVDSVQPIHIIPIDLATAGDIDTVAFYDIQKQLGDLGFSQAIQMTIPQLPGPNFFDVGFRDDTNVYCEILKMPNVIGCKVSYVTVFTNGVWYSTNGWAGTGQQLDYLISEFYPDQTPQQLYQQHIQGVQKLMTANGWDVQKAGLNRYIASLSDHLRWYLSFKKIAGYQADFGLWH